MTSPHFLQGPEWAQFQRSLGNEVIERSGPEWSYRAVVEHGRGSARLYCPYGPTVESVDGLQAALEDLRKEAQTRGLIFVRVEPIGIPNPRVLPRLGLQPAASTVQPPDTAVIDVSAGTDAILAGVRKSRRSKWRAAGRAGVTYTESTDPADIESFIDHIEDVAARTGMMPHEPAYFRKLANALMPTGAASFLFAELDDERIASVILFHGQDTDYYAHAASLSAHSKLSPPNAAVIEALQLSHARGASTFDLFGVAPADAPDDHPWAGFTAFKFGFGPERVRFSGTWELPVRPLRYRAYRLALSAVEKIKAVQKARTGKKKD